MYLFDTDTICNILKRKPSRRLLDRLESVSSGQQFISTVTVSEIVYGALRSQHPEHHMKNLEQVLLPNVNVLVFDSKAAYICGRIRCASEKAGITRQFADMQIAATALATDMTLVTGNVRHFTGIEGLIVENWI